MKRIRSIEAGDNHRLLCYPPDGFLAGKVVGVIPTLAELWAGLWLKYPGLGKAKLCQLESGDFFICGPALSVS